MFLAVYKLQHSSILCAQKLELATWTDIKQNSEQFQIYTKDFWQNLQLINDLFIFVGESSFMTTNNCMNF